MIDSFKKMIVLVLALACISGGVTSAQHPDLPDPLKPWADWVTWDVGNRNCPPAYNNSLDRVCFWPSRLSLSTGQRRGSWEIAVVVFAKTWVPIPGSKDVWPQNVTANGTPAAVIAHDGTPSVQLLPGRHVVSGEFVWEQMPQRMAIPEQIGMLSLEVDNKTVPLPSWDSQGNVWLQRLRPQAAEKNLLTAQVNRVIEDGIPVWLRTDIVLTVSGKSREEELGWALPEDWVLATVESPIPVSVDERGRIKAQVRAGKWTISLHSFRATDARDIQFSPDAQPIVDSELIGFRANPELRVAEIADLDAVDVTQTTFPQKWRDLPVYQWKTESKFQVVEKMRGMGSQRSEGLDISRVFWLNEEGQSLIYHDAVRGRMQQTRRLDASPSQQLGAVRIDGEGQLITSNPATGAHGVEVRTHHLNLEAFGRIQNTSTLSATGWLEDANSLEITLNVPPGWRVFALFGVDDVEGDWLTSWSLLDLFLLLVFGMAVLRMWGIPAGVIAFLAFSLAYHEPGAPRLTWLLLLIPLGLLRVVPEGAAQKWIKAWKYVMVAFLFINLTTFLAYEIQTVLYPQLEQPGVNYSTRSMFRPLNFVYQSSTKIANLAYESDGYLEQGNMPSTMMVEASRSKFQSTNLLFDPKARIQTGPAQPEWNWNRVHCKWDGPVKAGQQIRPILISKNMNRLITIVRIGLLGLLASILLGARWSSRFFSKRAAGAAIALILVCFVPGQLPGQEIPNQSMLQKLRERLLEPDDAFPHAAEIPLATLSIEENRVTMDAEIHAALEVAVPLPGRLPTWSPVSVTVDGKPTELVGRKNDYLWVVVPPGVHHVVVTSMLPDVSEWQWTFLLEPRVVSIDAPGWMVTGVRPNGIPENQIFFSRERASNDNDADVYDRKDFAAIVALDRHLETGLIWQVRNEVTRLSPLGKPVSIKIPLLPGEGVLTSGVVADDRFIEVNLSANQEKFSWNSELPVGTEIHLFAQNTNQWVERWHLTMSPVWNLTRTGLAPIFEENQQALIPVWYPWPGEEVTLAFNRPEAVVGDTMTVQRVRHVIELGRRRRTTELHIDLESSLGSDFRIEIGSAAEVSSVTVGGRSIPVRRDGTALIVPVPPGKRTIDVAWQADEVMQMVDHADEIRLPIDSANITTILQVPSSRWVLWTHGPTRGPAVRFWVVLVFAILAASVLGGLSLSPLSRLEWVLLSIGLTQIHLAAAAVVVAWLFLLASRGRSDPMATRHWLFNLRQVGLVLLTLIALGILIVVVGAGLLGRPEMFIAGNGSFQSYLQWFEPRSGTGLPQPMVVSVSVWFYRLLMLFWALWLAASLLRWLAAGWQQFSRGGVWMHKPITATKASP